MPLGMTGGFDLVLAVSTSSFESILESRLLGALPAPPAGGLITVTVPGGTLAFAAMRVTALFPPTGGTTFTLFLEMVNATAQLGPIAGALGPLSQISVPC